jgi:hypothetical protein
MEIYIMAKKAAKPSNPTTAPFIQGTSAPAAAERSEVKGSGTAAKTSASREITQDQIAKRAFEIYAGRGYAPGDQHADWLEAERQLRAGL